MIPRRVKFARAFVLASRQPAILSALIFGIILALHFTATAQTKVSDLFGRSLNQHGITLVDWDGYLANPLIKIYLLPPTNAALPGSTSLTADGARLYFDMASEVSGDGPGKTVSFTD